MEEKKKEEKIMDYKIMKIENRIAILQNRDAVMNAKIINKLNRQLRKLKK